VSLLIVAVIGYLIGTISFTRLIGRFVLPGEDLSETEYQIPESDETWIYRGVSASSVVERAGWKAGLAVVILDALKGLVPTLALLIAFPDSPAYAVGAAAVLVGHVWPVWFRFEGGRGQSVLIGALIAIDVFSLPVAILAGAALGIVVFTSVYMARNMWPVPLIAWFWWSAGISADFWFAVIANVVYWVASRSDIVEALRVRRLRGISDMSYPDRLRHAWRAFFSED
jgi:glycerol-3-phosphate acyltransferase PlsY